MNGFLQGLGLNQMAEKARPAESSSTRIEEFFRQRSNTDISLPNPRLTLTQSRAQSMDAPVEIELVGVRHSHIPEASPQEMNTSGDSNTNAILHIFKALT